MYGVIVFYTQEVSISSVTLSTVSGTKAFFLICALMLFSFAHASTLNVGVIHDNVGERENFAIIKEAFETAHPEIKLNISGYYSNTLLALTRWKICKMYGNKTVLMVFFPLKQKPC